MAQIAWIGLGTMGFHMAGYLARAGHSVAVYNRTREKSTRWVAQFADADGTGNIEVYDTPAQAAKNAAAETAL